MRKSLTADKSKSSRHTATWKSRVSQRQSVTFDGQVKLRRKKAWVRKKRKQMMRKRRMKKILRAVFKLKMNNQRR